MAASTLHLLLIVLLIIAFVVLVIYVLVNLGFSYLDEYTDTFFEEYQNQDNHGKESTTGRNGKSQKHN